MCSNLKFAQDQLSRIRFELDQQSSGSQLYKLDDGSRLKSFANLQHLKITQGVTPKLYESLETVLGRLGIPHKSVEAFVYNSPEIQAECFSLAWLKVRIHLPYNISWAETYGAGSPLPVQKKRVLRDFLR